VPPRFLSLAIIAFWLATTGWLFQRDLWPQLRPGEPPPYAIDLAFEVQDPMPIRWGVFRGSEMVGRARSFVHYRAADDTFELHGDLAQADKNRPFELISKPASVRLEKAMLMYRVTRAGVLREILTDATLGVAMPGGLPLDRITAHFQGEVRDGRFQPRGHVTCLGVRKELQGESIEVSSGGMVLNSLHPVNRIHGLRPGQSWRVSEVDPLADALAAALAAKLPFGLPGLTGPRILDAKVLSELQDLEWDRAEVPCLVIEYRNDGKLVASTWVRQSDGLVLRQEAQGWGGSLLLKREP
jgi:hypothetical protein